MRRFKSLFLSGIISMLLLATNTLALAESAQTNNINNFTPEQTKQIQQIVHDYLLQNPQILVQVANALQQQQQASMMQKAQKAIASNAQGLFNSSTSPVGGNPQGTITLVEFFDYQCPHCKDMAPTVANIVKNNPQVRVIYKEFPIFPNSEMIAKAALAAQKQGKFVQFHEALMQATNPISQADILKIAQSVGLNVTQLQNDITNPAIANEIKNNYKLANNLGLDFTPAFIVASNTNAQNPNDIKSYFIPGEVSQAVLNNIIAQVTKQSNT